MVCRRTSKFFRAPYDDSGNRSLALRRSWPVSVDVRGVRGAQDRSTDEDQHDVSTGDMRRVVQFRRPVALQLSRDGKQLVVANRKSGTISLLDTTHNAILGEFRLGSRISDITLVPESELFVLADQVDGTIACFELGGTEPLAPEVLWKSKTVGYPHAVQFNGAGNRLAVLGLWSRQIAVFEQSRWRTAPTLAMVFQTDFNPGHACWISDDRLLIADAFGESIAIIDVGTERILTSRITGHRTGGLALSSDRQFVAFSDQRLNPLARSNRNDVHWGLMISNQLRWLRTDSLLDVTSETGLAQLLKQFDDQPVGETGNAKADLGDLTFAANGTLAVTIGGVNELAIGQTGRRQHCLRACWQATDSRRLLQRQHYRVCGQRAG